MAHKKLRILYIAKLFYEQTDEDHPVAVGDIIAYLEGLGIHAERKAVYDDLELLRMFGMDIVYLKTRTHNYYLGQREFELPELKMLIDVVQASPFLTARKSMELIGKLETLTSAAQAAGLRRQVYVLDRVKTPNEQLYYNIDGINQAINRNVCIRFRYFDWSARGERVYRRGGAYYEECPVALCVDRNYYLIAYRPGQQKYVHFRVDRISDLRAMEGAPRPQLPEQFDLSSYVKSIFDMHSGQRQLVTLSLDQSLLNVAMDRFGRDAHYRTEDGHVIVTAEVDVSPTFLSWVLCFGGKARILSPASTVQALRALALEALSQYGGEMDGKPGISPE